MARAARVPFTVGIKLLPPALLLCLYNSWRMRQWRMCPCICQRWPANIFTFTGGNNTATALLLLCWTQWHDTPYSIVIVHLVFPPVFVVAAVGLTTYLVFSNCCTDGVLCLNSHYGWKWQLIRVHISYSPWTHLAVTHQYTRVWIKAI